MRNRRTRKQKSVELSLELKRLLLSRRRPEDIFAAWPVQAGGGIVTQNGFRYDYREFPMGNLIEIRGGRTRGKRECFLLLLEPDNNTAILQGIKAGEDCSLDGGATTKNMLKAAFILAKERGAKSISLSDTSKKYIDDTHFFYLSEMYFVTYGMTWYEAAGLGIRPPDDKLKLVNLWRKYAHTNTWDAVASKLEPFPDVPIDISDINTSAPGSAMQMFKRIKEANTSFFVDYSEQLLGASNIGSISLIAWIADL